MCLSFHRLIQAAKVAILSILPSAPWTLSGWFTCHGRSRWSMVPFWLSALFVFAFEAPSEAPSEAG